MENFLRGYIRRTDFINWVIGQVAMYLIFLMMGVLLWSSISKTFFLPSLWTLEMAQYTMMAYFIVGGAYAIQMGAHVRMDLFYGEWSPRRKAAVDVMTVTLLLFYLGVLLYGGIKSTGYAIEYGERARSAWRPYMWPIKSIMCFGIILMIIQSLSELAKDILTLRGTPYAKVPATDAETNDAL